MKGQGTKPAFGMWISTCPGTLCEMIARSTLTSQHCCQEATDRRLRLAPGLLVLLPWVLWSPRAGPCCLACCSFMVKFEIKKSKICTWFCFETILARLDAFHFHLNFRINLSISAKMPSGILVQISLNLQNTELQTFRTWNGSQGWAFASRHAWVSVTLTAMLQVPSHTHTHTACLLSDVRGPSALGLCLRPAQ